MFLPYLLKLLKVNESQVTEHVKVFLKHFEEPSQICKSITIHVS